MINNNNNNNNNIGRLKNRVKLCETCTEMCIYWLKYQEISRREKPLTGEEHQNTLPTQGFSFML